ncbi:MAG: hypothetical protein K6T83_01150 [Alicyclobacillus sp.]|nr:hypothetical protein [Alicyclobacillus sp.]
MINVGNVLNNPRFAQSFTVYRKSGSWVGGRWIPSETAIQMSGTITVPSATDLEQVPEGDRQKGAICVYTQAQLVVTNDAGTSDEIVWRGNRYRAAQLFPYADYGYYKAIAIKMDPSSEVNA